MGDPMFPLGRRFTNTPKLQATKTRAERTEWNEIACQRQHEVQHRRVLAKVSRQRARRVQAAASNNGYEAQETKNQEPRTKNICPGSSQ